MKFQRHYHSKNFENFHVLIKGENIENEITKSDDDEIVEEHEPLAIEHVKEGELDEEEETEEGPTTQIPDGHGGIKRLSMQVRFLSDQLK